MGDFLVGVTMTVEMGVILVLVDVDVSRSVTIHWSLPNPLEKRDAA